MNATPDPSTFSGPASIPTEQALLGAALVDNSVIGRVSSLVDAEDFSEQLHGLLWNGMLELSAQGIAIDRLMMQTLMGDRDLGGITAMQYVAKLAADAVTAVNASSYARAVRDMADMRRAYLVGQDLIAKASQPGKPADIATAAIDALDAIATRANGNAVPRVSAGQAAASALSRAAEVRSGKRTPYGASYGIRALNQKTLGLHAGELVIIQARPSMGKSTVAVSSAIAAAKSGDGVYLVSLEMTDLQLGERALSNLCFGRGRTPIAYQDIRAGKIDDDQFGLLEQARDHCDTLPIIIEQESGLTLSQIAARARQAKQKLERSGGVLKVVIVDHIGIIRSSNRYAGNRVQEMTEISGALKALAKELGVCVMALSQMNRGAEARDQKRPQLSDLRESGSIEQDADVVIGIYREDYYLARKPDRTDEEEQRLLDCQNTMEFIILKQRQGELGTVHAFASMPCGYIGDLQP